MEKIQALFEKAGVKPELAKQIFESLDRYKRTLREQFEAEYAAKVEQAKKVCIEETEAHKRELARRVQIFCETKGAAIEAKIAKQSALSESEALTKLHDVATIVSGFASNGRANGDVTATIEKLKRKARVANEEKDRAVELANRKTAIAEKALSNNRRLVTENTQLKRKLERPSNAVTEGRQLKRGRIDRNRRGSKPLTTRATILENQDRRPPERSPQTHVQSPGNGTFSVEGIASSMDEDLF